MEFRPCFGGLTFKNRGQLGSRSIFSGVDFRFSCQPHVAQSSLQDSFLFNHDLGGSFQMFFIFTPYLGKIIILTDIFQMGWNHQPVMLWIYKHYSYSIQPTWCCVTPPVHFRLVCGLLGCWSLEACGWSKSLWISSGISRRRGWNEQTSLRIWHKK